MWPYCSAGQLDQLRGCVCVTLAWQLNLISCGVYVCVTLLFDSLAWSVDQSHLSHNWWTSTLSHNALFRTDIYISVLIGGLSCIGQKHYGVCKIGLMRVCADQCYLIARQLSFLSGLAGRWRIRDVMTDGVHHLLCDWLYGFLHAFCGVGGWEHSRGRPGKFPFRQQGRHNINQLSWRQRPNYWLRAQVSETQEAKASYVIQANRVEQDCFNDNARRKRVTVKSLIEDAPNPQT